MPSGSAPRPSSTINSVGSLKPIAGFPTFDDAAHDFGRKAAADGETDPDSWTAVGGIGGGHGNADNTTYAYAICTGDRVNASGMTTRVHHRDVAGPTEGGTGRTATVGCVDDYGQHRDGRGRRHGARGDREILISGGAAASGGGTTTTGFTKAGSGGTHLNGSFPSDSDGNPVGDGTTTATHWTAAVHAGGSPSPNTCSDVWALCLTMHGRHDEY